MMAVAVHTYRSPFGTIELACDGAALTALRFVEASAAATRPAPEAVRCWLDAYFAGRRPLSLPRLAPTGTPFQLRVWRELLAIPYGQTVTYGQLASRIGCRSPQAVGQAVGRNPIAILIPCHRVVARHGIGGYAYGIALKQRLLSLEHITDTLNLHS